MHAELLIFDLTKLYFNFCKKLQLLKYICSLWAIAAPHPSDHT